MVTDSFFINVSRIKALYMAVQVILSTLRKIKQNGVIYIILPLFVTLKNVYDRNIVNKYGLYLLLGVIIYNLIDYTGICNDAELFISFCRILYIYIYVHLKNKSFFIIICSILILLNIYLCLIICATLYLNTDILKHHYIEIIEINN